jgi:hypothetical protein
MVAAAKAIMWRNLQESKGVIQAKTAATIDCIPQHLINRWEYKYIATCSDSGTTILFSLGLKIIAY